jgi:hypothetical protein
MWEEEVMPRKPLNRYTVYYYKRSGHTGSECVYAGTGAGARKSFQKNYPHDRIIARIQKERKK